ncbi:MAG TPA: hypothetical protein VN025_05915 [Candidatus Dormibacteraeota bacterium]|jgi:hypothetical protein|nr:hypothetical protein [Candidatus Dormibacteraeota bacterium]
MPRGNITWIRETRYRFAATWPAQVDDAFDFDTSDSTLQIGTPVFYDKENNKALNVTRAIGMPGFRDGKFLGLEYRVWTPELEALIAAAKVRYEADRCFGSPPWPL